MSFSFAILEHMKTQLALCLMVNINGCTIFDQISLPNLMYHYHYFTMVLIYLCCQNNFKCWGEACLECLFLAPGASLERFYWANN